MTTALEALQSIKAYLATHGTTDEAVDDYVGRLVSEVQPPPNTSRRAVLDHGYVQLVEHWGSDERVVEAARMSTGKGFLGWGGPCRECDEYGRLVEGTTTYVSEVTRQNAATCACKGAGVASGDEKLLRYLWEHKHATPFEMAGAVFEVALPIFVTREWHRHRTQGYSEVSARYTPLPDVNYVPSVERLLINSKTNRQAGVVRGAEELTETGALHFMEHLRDQYTAAEEMYQRALSKGVPKELARVILPVGRYTRMRATANLRNWLGFLALRAAPDAQWEIRQYAFAVRDALAELFPRTMALSG